MLAINVGELNIYRNAYRVADTRPGLSYLLITPGLLDARAEAAGPQALAFWCPPNTPCHADVLIELLSAG